MGPRSPLRFGRCRTDVPPDVLQPIFRKASVVVGQAPMVQGLASGSVGSWHEVPRTSLGLRSAPVVAEQTSPGRLAPVYRSYNIKEISFMDISFSL